MNILVYTSLFPNHMNPDFGIFIKNRMAAFSRRKGCQIVVVAPVPYCPRWKFLGKRYKMSQIKKQEYIDGIPVYHPRYFMIPKMSMMLHGLLMFIASIRTVKRIRKGFLFDLIDAHYIYPDGFAGMLLARLFNTPLVVSARGSDIHRFSRMGMIRLMIQKTLKRAQYRISVCRALEKVMIDLGSPPDTTVVIPNGVDVKRFFPLQTGEARQCLSIAENKKVILSVGALIPLKGHHIVIEAMKEIVERKENVHLYIAGKGDYLLSLENKILELDLKGYVTLLGHVDNAELVKWYSAADVFCLASSREGWANVLMESMACGTPVVATNVWGAPEIITNPEVGILTQRTPGAIAASLITALDKEWDRERIKQHVGSRSWDIVAQEVNDVFLRVIKAWQKQK
ncbi:glycosyltransferase family 4 protein [Desulfobacter postgatei]|jgi:glycosyltransferase involved in cell wall biosynthesis|uniref:glycosyltransferase family 4 protein n=1 Tax=Desulfobacter postgatei TaxID=2293 RepID=UPI002A36EE52|nr:glycosyltransferase family 4 protein [Desulfobacter postgatei]MDX9964210.1 glycosyltransferase family 4 protein [Desulfobacter postgatei]